MRYQVTVTLVDGSKYILEKINTTDKEINEIKRFYKIPPHLHEKAVFIARQFNENQLKKIINFLTNNDYIMEFHVAKINPHTLEDDVISLGKIVRTYTESSNWESISFEIIDGMFIMGYGLIDENYEARKNLREFNAVKQILNMLGEDITIKHIERIQNYLKDIKGVEDIFQYVTELQESSPENLNKILNEIDKILKSSDKREQTKVIKLFQNKKQSQ